MSTSEIIQQRCVVKFFQKWGKTPTETFLAMRAVYGEQTLSRANVFRWHGWFAEGRESVDDVARPGRPCSARTSATVAKVREVVNEDRRLGVRDISERVGVDRETVRRILNDDLGLTKRCAKLVPKNLNFEQKLKRLRICEDWLGSFDDTFNRVIVAPVSYTHLTLPTIYSV